MVPKPNERWRWHVRAALASAITNATRLQRPAARAREQRRPLILGYHRVVDDFAAASMTDMRSMLISRAMFERHIDHVGRSFRFVTLDEIGEHLATGRPFLEPVAAITFDDGYQDVYENAFPVLKRKGIPAAMFVVTDLVGREAWQTHDRLYTLVEKAYAQWPDPRYRLAGLLSELQLPGAEILASRSAAATAVTTVTALLPVLSQADVTRLIESLEATVGYGTTRIPLSLTWSMIHEMRGSVFTIGSHTMTHVTLPMESAAVVARELEGSKRELESQLAEPVKHFAYPGGQFTPEVVAALSRAGYQFAYTACPHQEPRYPLLTIERLLLWEGSSIDAHGEFSSAVLNCQVHDLWPPARRCERLHHA
jgi:peptidoglycan/xylan/chitin deacetylase (PgdA/CDA1 family)